MNKIFLIIFLILGLSSLASGDELFLCRNVLLTEPVSITQIEKARRNASSLFHPGDRITAVFSFTPISRNGSVEFKWFHAESGRKQFSQYIHTYNRATIGKEYVSFAWLIVDPSMFDKMLGSKYAGNWFVEVHSDGKWINSRSFSIKHD